MWTLGNRQEPGWLVTSLEVGKTRAKEGWGVDSWMGTVYVHLAWRRMVTTRPRLTCPGATLALAQWVCEQRRRSSRADSVCEPQHATPTVADAPLPAVETNAGSLMWSPLEEAGWPPDSKLVALHPFHSRGQQLISTGTNTLLGSLWGCRTSTGITAQGCTWV